MRKSTVSVITTVDGDFEGPGKDVMAMPFDDGFSRYDVELLRNADAVVHRGVRGERPVAHRPIR